MRIVLPYGRSGLEVEIPGDRIEKVLRMRPPRPIADVRGAVAAALENPTGSPPLGELARGKRTACVAVCDITRPVPNRLLLPPIIEAIESAGVPRSGITILIATGLHRPNEGEELLTLVGQEMVERYRVMNHVARDSASHVYLGVAPAGTPAWVDRRFVEADLRVAIGFIEPHFMAGFSGGRKVVCPGLCSVETIRVFHGRRMLDHPLSREGVLEGNPVHEEALAIAKMAKVSFTVNVALDEAKQIVGIFAGALEESHREGVEFVRCYASDAPPRAADVVVTTAGGYPLDATFYQAIKGATAAVPAVKSGGTILLVAECSEGLGSPEFRRLLHDYPAAGDFAAAIARDDFFVMDQWEYQKLLHALGRARVMLVSDRLVHEKGLTLPVPVYARFADALGAALLAHGAQSRVVVIPAGPYVLVSGPDAVPEPCPRT